MNSDIVMYNINNIGMAAQSCVLYDIEFLDVRLVDRVDELSSYRGHRGLLEGFD